MACTPLAFGMFMRNVDLFVWLPTLGLLGLIQGCYTQKRFADEYAEATCLLYSDCEVLDIYTEYDGIEGCTSGISEVIQPATAECSAYDNRTAHDCVDGINEMDCQDLYDNVYPDACYTYCDGES